MLKMVSAIPASSVSSLLPNLSKDNDFFPKHIFQFKLGMNKNQPKHWVSMPKLRTATAIAFEDKLHRLVSEFQSLSEPIDRVKRLLQYAAVLPPLEESARVAENRVMGCGTQVWVVAEMDKSGRMRFKADSDSEISKGFCWCLIWMLDGAEPEEVMMVETEDLADINVGVHVKAHSRVNTWHNVLLSMQKATKALVLEMGGKR